MCGTCGCSHHVKHEHHDHHAEHTHTSHDMLRIEQDILAKNDAYAGENCNRLREAGTLAINLVSSPGLGKTTLLVKTIELLKVEASRRRYRGRSGDLDRRRAHPRHRDPHGSD